MALQIAADGKHSIHAGQRPRQAGKGTKGDKPGLRQRWPRARHPRTLQPRADLIRKEVQPRKFHPAPAGRPEKWLEDRLKRLGFLRGRLAYCKNICNQKLG